MTEFPLPALLLLAIVSTVGVLAWLRARRPVEPLVVPRVPTRRVYRAQPPLTQCLDCLAILEMDAHGHAPCEKCEARRRTA